MRLCRNAALLIPLLLWPDASALGSGAPGSLPGLPTVGQNTQAHELQSTPRLTPQPAPHLVQPANVVGTVTSVGVNGGLLQVVLRDGGRVTLRHWQGPVPRHWVGSELTVTVPDGGRSDEQATTLSVRRDGQLEFFIGWGLMGNLNVPGFPWSPVGVGKRSITLAPQGGATRPAAGLQLPPGRRVRLMDRTGAWQVQLLRLAAQRSDAAERPSQLHGGPSAATLLIEREATHLP